MAKPKRERATTNPFGQRINQVMREKHMPGDYAALAVQFGVKVPSVYGWIDNGRISKTKLPKLVEWSGRSLEWWLNSDQASTEATPQHSVHALATLQGIGKHLSVSDWQTVIQVAQQLASKLKPPEPAASPVGGVIAADKLQEMAAFQATAEELHAQSEAKLKRHRAS